MKRLEKNAAEVEKNVTEEIFQPDVDVVDIEELVVPVATRT